LRSSGKGRIRLGLDPDRPEPLRFGKSGAPYLVPVAAALVLAVVLGFGWRRVSSCGAPTAWASPETQVREALANQNRGQLSDVYGFKSGGTAELFPLRFAEPAVSVEGGRATVAAMLDAEGRVAWRDQTAHLRYLGREKFHMSPCRIAGWCGEGDQFERLRGVLVALFRRHDAQAARDPRALAPLVDDRYADLGETKDALLVRLGRSWAAEQGRPSVRAWQVRVERESAEVGEDLEVARSDGPAQARALYRLRWDGARWVFTGGL
jgi:hypothetical protein